MHKILLADDTKVTLSVEKAYLESRDFKVFATTSAAEVVTLAGLIQPDLIVLDFEMPEMLGDEVCRRLKSEDGTAAIPILILSSHDDEETRRRCRDAGAVDFARKTEGREALLGYVARILNLPQRRHVRASCRFSIGVAGADARLRGTAHDISESGLYLTTDRPIAKGTPLQLGFRLPGLAADINVLAEAVRTEALGDATFGCGVQFLEPDDATLDAIRVFVQRTT